MTGKRYILDDDGTPVVEPDLMKWGEWFCRQDRHVAENIIAHVRVSTVFLGINNSFGCGAPLLFETMVFGGPFDGEQRRYSTKDEALAGHAEMLKKVKEA